MRSIFSAAMAGILLVSTAANILANVGDPARWKPNFERTFQSPPPLEAEARARAFAQRNSKANLENLAKEFFSLIDMSKVPRAVRAAMDQGDCEGALNAYRDFFMERLATFGADEKTNPGIRPRQPPFPFENAYLHTAEDLMNNTAVFGVIDMPLPPEAKSSQDYYDICNKNENQTKKGNVRITFGPPGRANWTWQPEPFVPLGFPHLPFDKSFMSCAVGRPHFFTPLLVKYIETKDAKYWEKWLGFTDDICINWRRDTLRAGLNPSHNLNNIEFFTDGVWANLSYLMQNSPEMVKAIPAPTLVRLLDRMWMEYMSDALQYGRNLSTARRIMFDNFHDLRIAVSFPEFKGSDYCIREMVRTVESLPMLSLMPDGCDVHDSRNYNKGTPEYVQKIYTMVRSARPGAAVGRRSVAPGAARGHEAAGRLHHSRAVGHRRLSALGIAAPGNRRVRWLRTRISRRYVPEAFADPDNAKILSNIFEDGKAGTPSFTSDAFPYAGFYCVRTGWTKQDQWLYMPSTRPVSSVTHPDNNGISLYAYGRHLLANTGTSTPVTVDGCSQISDGSYLAAPERYRNDIFRPVYGRAGSANAYRTPLARRWHTFGILRRAGRRLRRAICSHGAQRVHRRRIAPASDSLAAQAGTLDRHRPFAESHAAHLRMGLAVLLPLGRRREALSRLRLEPDQVRRQDAERQDRQSPRAEPVALQFQPRANAADRRRFQSKSEGATGWWLPCSIRAGSTMAKSRPTWKSWSR